MLTCRRPSGAASRTSFTDQAPSPRISGNSGASTVTRKLAAAWPPELVAVTVTVSESADLGGEGQQARRRIDRGAGPGHREAQVLAGEDRCCGDGLRAGALVEDLLEELAHHRRRGIGGGERRGLGGDAAGAVGRGHPAAQRAAVVGVDGHVGRGGRAADLGAVAQPLQRQERQAAPEAGRHGEGAADPGDTLERRRRQQRRRLDHHHRNGDADEEARLRRAAGIRRGDGDGLAVARHVGRQAENAGHRVDRGAGPGHREAEALAGEGRRRRHADRRPRPSRR